jgi:integrase
MKLQLTDRFCATIKPRAAQTDYIDETVPGLTLRVSKHGTKAFNLLYTTGGKLHRLGLGRYPDISLAAARGKALEAKEAVAEGLDPRQREALTLQSVFAQYLKREGHKLRSIEERKAVFARVVLPVLGSRPIAEIKRSEIVRMLDEIEDHRGPSTAHLALAYLSKLMNFHASRDDEFRSPIVRGMGRINAKERERTRILTDDEIRAIWLTDDSPFNRYVRFLLLTAVRRIEAARMEWSEVVGDVWTVPAARMKGKLDHVVPLSQKALAQMKPNNHRWVFTLKGNGPLNSFGDTKEKFDADSATSGWTLHDLRRTARSLMSRAGVSPDIAERCLAHTIPGVRGVYDRHAYLDEKREALGRLARLVGEIVNG